MYSRVIGTGSALPSMALSNEAFAKQLAEAGVETSDEWIRSRTGIENRYFADASKGETTTSLATLAARRAVEAAGVTSSEIDLIIVATTTPDMVFPSVACRVQAALGAKGCAAFDVQAVCAGFIYALNAADAMLRAGPYRCAVVIGAEVMSRVLDMSDRSTCVLFGDGAGAVVLRSSSDPGILAARMYADGQYDDKVLGLTASLNHGRIEGDPFLRMDGRQVFRLAVEGLVNSAREVANLACVHTEDVALFVPHQANLRIMTMVDGRQVFRLAVEGLVNSAREVANLACVHTEDVALFVPHQANLRIMTMVANKLGIPEDRMVKTVAEHGNTSAAWLSTETPLRHQFRWR